MPGMPIAVRSPCVGVCALDAHETCTGCHRTLDEIVRWRSMSDAERVAVLRRLSADSRPGR
jgi:predicted Fe-S protein YdhL (DUF1289 family)